MKAGKQLLLCFFQAGKMPLNGKTSLLRCSELNAGSADLSVFPLQGCIILFSSWYVFNCFYFSSEVPSRRPQNTVLKEKGG